MKKFFYLLALVLAALTLAACGKEGEGGGEGPDPESNDNPNPSRWVQKSNYPGAGYELFFSAGGKVYTIENNRLIYEYDPATDKWSEKADCPNGNNVNFVIGDKAYVIGTSSSWEYDSKTDVWTQKTTYPRASNGLYFAFSIGDRGYVNGYSGFYDYNQTTDSWTQLARSDFYSGTAASSDELGYVLTDYRDFYTYNPSSDRWSPKADYFPVNSVHALFVKGGILHAGPYYELRGPFPLYPHNPNSSETYNLWYEIFHTYNDENNSWGILEEPFGEQVREKDIPHDNLTRGLMCGGKLYLKGNGAEGLWEYTFK